MTVKDLNALFDYGYWANRKLFDVVAELTDEEFTQAVAGSHGSVRNTLVHVRSVPSGDGSIGVAGRHADRSHCS